MWLQLGIIGKSGTGKTYLTNVIIHNISHNRVIVIDDHKQLESLTVPDFFIANSFDEFSQMIIGKKDFKIVCSFETTFDYDLLFALLWKLNNLVIIIDEVSLYADTFNLDENLKEIILRGRLKNISLIWNTQRPALVNRTIFSQLTDLICFNIFDVRDIAYIPRHFRETDSLSKLKRGEYKIVIQSSEFLEKLLKNKKKS